MIITLNKRHTYTQVLSNNDSTACVDCHLRDNAHALQKELEWACARTGSMWNLDDTNTFPNLEDEDAFEACLTKWELECYTDYVKQFPDSVYSLTQNPNTRPTYAKGKVGFIAEVKHI